MENSLLNKKITDAVTLFLLILSVFFVFKTVNEFKQNKYIGAGVTPGNTITISGTGEVNAVPDVATETITIEEEGKTQKEAGDKVAVKEKKALEFLRGAGVADKDIKTVSNSVYPKYEYMQADSTLCRGGYCPGGKQTIVGYTANETISVKIRNVDDTGKIVQGLTDVGVQLSGPDFTIDDEDELKAEARKLAIADAKEKADTLEDDLGIELGRIVNFSEGSGGYPMMYAKAELSVSDAGAPAPELPKGENKITSNITITYEVK